MSFLAPIARRRGWLIALIALAACNTTAKQTVRLPTATVTRGDIAVKVQATGVVEPVNPVDIKSKVSGMVTQLPVDVGTQVKAGDLLVQVDPRDVQNQYAQAVADDVAVAASLSQARSAAARSDSLFRQRVITAQEHEAQTSTLASARSRMVTSRSALDIARQHLEDATIRSPLTATVVAKPVSKGQIIVAALSANGGTPLMTLADLGRVRMRVTVNEVELGNVRVGLPAAAQVDAFPERRFDGVVEKIEPQAVVQQGVTFFPVMVSVDNRERLLMPGMNGEVTIASRQRTNVIKVTIDAVRNMQELAPVSRIFGIGVDSLRSLLRQDLVNEQSVAAAKAHYAVVSLADSTYEMRLVTLGSNDLSTSEVVDGLREGEQVLLLGTVALTHPTVMPKLKLAANLQRTARPGRTADVQRP